MSKTIQHVAFGLLLGTMGLWGLAVTLPHGFQSGEVVSAGKMNQNFQALAGAVEALEANLAAAEARLEAIQAGQRALPGRSGRLGYATVAAGGSAFDTFNAAGGAVTAVHAGTGTYLVTFEDLVVFPTAPIGTSSTGGVVAVSAADDPAPLSADYGLYCNRRGVNPSDTQTSFTVRCYDKNGTCTTALSRSWCCARLRRPSRRPPRAPSRGACG